MIQIIKKLRVLLDKKQKRTMVGLIILMVISAFLQTAGVGMLVEVMQIVIDPEAVQHSRVAEACYEIMGVESYRTFSIIVMVLLILVFVVKNLFTYVQQKLTLSFVYTNQFRTSERMMRNYLRRGYEFYLNADTAVVQRSITSDVNNMYALILALLQLLSDSVVSLFVISYCFISSGTMTILMAVVLLLLMWLIKRVLKPIMYKAGKDNQDYYSSLFKWISQTVLGYQRSKDFRQGAVFVSSTANAEKARGCRTALQPVQSGAEAADRDSLRCHYGRIHDLSGGHRCAYRKYADSVRNSGSSGTSTVALREPYQQPDQFHRLF